MPNNPPVPEKKVNVEITKREWNVLLLLRQIGFGKVTLQKMNNVIVRVESTVSTVVNEEMEISKGV